MAFTGVLPTIFLGAAFLGLAYFVWSRKKWAAALPVLIGLGLIIYAFNVYAKAGNYKIAQSDYVWLLTEWGRADLQDFILESPTEENLFAVSLYSQALYQSVQQFPGEKERAITLLAPYAAWVANARNFDEWRLTNRWDEAVFFLAHASIILGHYQDLSKDETHAARWRQIGEYLGRALPASRYKNLLSRQREELYRPADNAAALYALKLYDDYYAAELSFSARKNWLQYLKSELEYAESHLPCSAFSSTNTCKLDPTAGALGLMLAYLGAAGSDDEIQLYREWLHYFKNFSFSPLSVDFNGGMQKKEAPRFCNEGAFPLACNDALDEIGMWLAAEYGGHYTYARLLSKRILRGAAPATGQTRPIRRLPLLNAASIRVIAEMQ